MDDDHRVIQQIGHCNVVALQDIELPRKGAYDFGFSRDTS